MKTKKFVQVAMTEANSNWNLMVSRYGDLPQAKNEIRSPFARDYTRILHSNAYRRLKHKTQVFFNIDNDHVCTRIEHVGHVESVSSTIARELGLNEELTKAIAIGHDLGHAPFGHEGEVIINALRKECGLAGSFWHEKNGVYFADNLELLRDRDDKLQNLCLTYAVRDGIISHCGEIDQNNIRPRADFGDLYVLEKGSFNPGTWEACVVKIADKIAYLGRDIEDAKSLHFLDAEALDRLKQITDGVVNTTNIIGEMVADICANSSPETGIRLSTVCEHKMNLIKKYNYDYIYGNERLEPFRRYAALVTKEIFGFLHSAYDENYGYVNWNYFMARRQCQTLLIKNFMQWLTVYTKPGTVSRDLLMEFDLAEFEQNNNKKVYDCLQSVALYNTAVLDFIAGMTDRFALDVFGELLKY